MSKYYVVFKGVKTGIFKSFEEIKKYVINYPGAKYKSFSNLEDAQEYLKNGPTKFSNDVIINKPKKTKDELFNKTLEKSLEKSLENKHEEKTLEKTLENKIMLYNKKQLKDKNLYIYTDGSVKNNGKKYATGGYGVFFSDFENISFITKQMKNIKITTPMAELQAIIDGLEYLEKLEVYNNYENIYLYTDSEYCYKSLTIWYKQWEKNDFKSKTKEPIKNLDSIKSAYNLINNLKVKLIHINSHTGKTDIHYLGNDIADYLAKYTYSNYLIPIT
jgi:ribonuclease HI